MGRFWLFAVAMIFAAAGAFAVLILRPAEKPAPANAAIGATIAVDPDATIAAQAGATLVARLTSPVHLNDLIATGPDGAIRVQFTDATFFSLGANASARVDTYVFDPENNSSGISMALQRGAFRFVSGRARHEEGRTRVNTPVAVIGVRGTGFNVVIGPQAEVLFRRVDPRFVPDGGDASTATLILLTEGAVDVDGSGQKVALEIPGQVLFFRRRGEPPIGPLMAWTAVRTEIGALASPPALGPEPGGREPPVPPPVTSPGASPSPKPSVTPSPTPRSTPTVRPTPTPSPKATPRPTPRPTFTPRPTPTPRITPKPTPTPRFTPRPTPTPRFTPRPTPTPRVTPRPTPTPRFTPRPTPTPRFTPRPTPTATPRPRPTRAPLTNVPRTRPTGSPTPVKR